MNYTAQVKEIHKTDNEPFGDNGMLTYKMKTSKHEGLLYTPKLNIQKGDEINYDYYKQKDQYYKFAKVKKVAMYNNFKKDTSTQPVSKPLDTHSSILRQVAFKGAIELASSGKINIQEIEEFTNTFNQILK